MKQQAAAAAINKPVYVSVTSRDPVASPVVGYRDTCCTLCQTLCKSLLESIGQWHHTENWVLVNYQLQQIDHWLPKIKFRSLTFNDPSL